MAEIEGSVSNEEGEPVPNVSVALTNPDDASIIKGTVTNDSGAFTLSADPGSYILLVSYISYRNHTVEISLNAGENLDLGNIELIPEDARLDEVIVEGERSYMEMNFDSRSFNVGKDITSLGGNALDVLDNVPSITTDFEGNVSLRGNEGVQILINGRPSNLVRGGTDGLGSIPASMINEIKIITNPSARYEAQGTGGIINIKLVDNAQLGFNGSIQSNVGYPQDHGAGINLNYNNNNINWFLNLDFEYESEPETGSSFQSFSEDTTYVYRETNDVTERESEGDIDFGADFYLPREQVLTISSRISVEEGEEDGDLLYTDYLPNSPGVYRNTFEDWDILRQANRSNLEESRETDYDVRLSYEVKFDGSDHRLTAEADYEFGSEGEDVLLSEDIEQGASDFRNQRTFSDEEYSELRIDSDYERPLGDNGRFEAGFRINLDWLDNNYRAQELINGNWTTPVEGMGLSENFTFFENVNALYSIYSGESGDFTYNMGLRLENTRIKTELDQTGEGSDQNYLNLFPSAFLSYTISSQNSLQFSYSRRISRPWSRFLLPFTEINDSRNRSVGNPNLSPEFGNSFELGYLRRWESGSVLSSVYYRYRTGVIDRISTIDGNGITTRRPINLATENSWGIEFSADQDLFETLSLSGSFNLYQSNRDGDYEGINYNSESESFTSRLRIRWRFLESWNFQSNIFYRGAQQTTQGQESGDAYVGSGLSKELLDGRATISLNVRDLLNTRQSDREIINPNSYTNKQYSWSSRSFRLNFRYNFSSGQ
ncbi:outer membrane beta-barrel family protein [Rhodohalobacter sp. 8-1]|uniref:outer membrane beta-barrel family protein n=1 Tax=Rhodohalobacter sp. 8-1 TaxID=3131972 RepID=UPI0030EF9069